MQFNDIEVNGFDGRVCQCLVRGFAGQRRVEVLAVVDGLGTCGGSEDSHATTGVKGEAFDGIVGGDDGGCCSFADRCALQAGEHLADRRRFHDLLECSGLAALPMSDYMTGQVLVG